MSGEGYKFFGLGLTAAKQEERARTERQRMEWDSRVAMYEEQLAQVQVAKACEQKAKEDAAKNGSWIVAEDDKHCAQCGGEKLEGAKFCGNCGEKIGDSPEKNEDT